MPSPSWCRYLTAEDWRAGGFGLYVHWPYCQAKCPYCDFNSHVAKSIDEAQWKSAYLSEIKRVSRETPGRTLTSVFFGGGTPSLMSPDLVGSIIDAIKNAWPRANDFEITLEANPTSVEAGRFQGFRDAGITRVSMGVQALNDADLIRLGRLHNTADAQKAFDIARKTFDRVSFDLIYARQYQTLDAWCRELSEALGMAIDHLSLYQLTIEAGTAFGDRYARGRLPGLIDEDLAADMYDLTQELCERAGLPAYEVSNHASDAAQSRHNLIYWRYGDYAGIGPGAHGRITHNGRRHAIETHMVPALWLEAQRTTGTGESLRTPLTSNDEAAEFTMMGLRLAEGISSSRYAQLSGKPFDTMVLDDLEALGLIWRIDDRLGATQTGRRLLNSVIEKLLI